MNKSVFSMVLALAACPALSADSSIDRLVNCTEIQDSPKRLACFDREVAPLASVRAQHVPGATPSNPVALRPAPGTPPTPASAAAATPSPSHSLRQSSFGEEQLRPSARPEQPREAQVLHARIDRLRSVTTNEFIVYLDNGQAWRHEDQVLGGYLRAGEAITISKGTLGSYRLTRDAGSSKNWIRVSRIK